MMEGKKISPELKAAREKYPKRSYFRAKGTYTIYQVACVDEDDIGGGETEIYIVPRAPKREFIEPLDLDDCEPFVFNEEKVK
jgi:hypothetical protein